MNPKELQDEKMIDLMDVWKKIHSEPEVINTSIKNSKEEIDDFGLVRRWDMCSNTVVRKSKEFLILKMMQARQRHLIQIRENVQKINASVKDRKEELNSCIKEDKTGNGKKHPVIDRDHEEIKKQLEQLSNKLEHFENKLHHIKQMMEKSGIFLVEHNSNMNRRQTPSEVLKSIRDDNCIEDRRCHVRREVSNIRRGNQLKTANLNRGLAMEEDNHEASKGDCTFDLKSLDEALPPVSHCRRAPGIKRRSMKLQDIVMNDMKERRLFRFATAGLFSMDNNMEENS